MDRILQPDSGVVVVVDNCSVEVHWLVDIVDADAEQEANGS